MVRRVGRDGDGAALRAFLLANAQAVLQSTLDGPGYRHGKRCDSPASPVDVDAEVAVEGSVAEIVGGLLGYVALRDGEEHTLERSELPDWHPLARAGHPGDAFVLTVGDELFEL